MKQYLFSALSALAITAMVGCSSTKSQTGSKGFTKIFDGKTTTGWHTYGKTTAGGKWKIQDGALWLDSKGPQDGGGDLVTDKEYSNFHLKYDWKVSPKANSGLIYYVHEDKAKYGATYSTGLEMQVIDNEGHPDGQYPKHRAGDLYDVIKSTSEPVKAVGEWNTAEIISKDGKLEQYLNGVKVVSTTLWDDNWTALINQSKFKGWKDWGTFKSGKIALQDHGDDVWYRNIMIKEL
ncbi:3-keto-disaccharide hydrolase [Pedobacter sp. GR22-6]|uniref:3-keto-disaccharide hydrolase n=1 Tax=Pedobacter sp. GR22-6 TaxID=3127957 RepID=UPI00307E06FA